MTTAEQQTAGNRLTPDSFHPRDLRGHGVSTDTPEERLALGLGWFSIALGATEVLAPGAIGRWLGVRDRDPLIRALGARGIASGIGIVTRPRPARGVWARVGGDLMDLAALGAALPRSERPRRVAGAMAVVAGITALDIVNARQLSRSAGVLPKNRTPEGGYRVRRAITIEASPETLYVFWRRLENLPRVMRHIDTVEDLGQGRSRWVARLAGIPITWEAEIVADEPNQRIAWKATDDSPIRHAGEVRFERAPRGGTVVRVDLEYQPPLGPLTRSLARLFGAAPEQEIDADLRPLKQLIETGEIATTDGQPSGRSLRRAVLRTVTREAS
jgi:uncharacterized membrane protein